MADPLRIVSYNVRYFGHGLRGLASSRASKRAIAGALSSLTALPDVVCLQEVETRSVRSNVGRAGRHPDETQLESFMGYLEEACARRGFESPYDALYFRAHDYRVGELSLYTTGLGVLVNRETVRVEDHNADAPRSITHHHVARFKERKQSRICAHLQVEDLRGRRFHVFNTHLSLPTPFAKDYWSAKDKMGFGVNQLEEAKRLSMFVQERAGGAPFVVCGDFNSPPGSPVFRHLIEDARFDCAQLRLGQIDLAAPRSFPTAGFLHLRMHLDHLFGGGALHFVDVEGTRPFGEGPFHGLSDHMPLIARFALDG